MTSPASSRHLISPTAGPASALAASAPPTRSRTGFRSSPAARHLAASHGKHQGGIRRSRGAKGEPQGHSRVRYRAGARGLPKPPRQPQTRVGGWARRPLAGNPAPRNARSILGALDEPIAEARSKRAR
jgi:hypothetical protein